MTFQPKFFAAVGLLCVAALSTPGAAHHAFASEFDSSKPLVVSGTVTKARFVNPHSWIYIDVKGADGKVTNWGFEFGTPSSLRSNGITRDQVAAGTAVKVAGFRAKNGGAFGYATTLVFANGRQVQTGSAPDAPPPPVR